MSNLWDDPYGHATERAYKHGPWEGMPPRSEWNASTTLRGCQTCIECGYRWGQTDFTYRSHLSNPSETHTICWNCWMIDNNPEKVQAYWRAKDGIKPESKRKTSLDHL